MGTGLLTVYRKEITDAGRDRRSLLVALVAALVMGPLMLWLLSAILAGLEEGQQEQRLWVQGEQHGKGLLNHLKRSGIELQPAPGDVLEQLRSGKGSRVLLILEPPDAVDPWGLITVRARLVWDSSRQTQQARHGRLRMLIEGYNREQALLRLATRGVAQELLRAVEVVEEDLSSPAARGAQYAAMLPFFLLMTVMYGAMPAALDLTAGERERGSLESLLILPVAHWELVLGKWLAVMTVSSVLVLVSSLGFMPAQALIQSESLAALLHYGWYQALGFMLALIPMASAASAGLMALALRSASVREAQTSCSLLVMVVSMVPMLSMFDQGSGEPWQRWVPGLAQVRAMNQILGSGVLPVADLLAAASASAVLTLLALGWMVHRLARPGVV